MDDRGGKFRQKKTNFSMVSNEILRNTHISLKAKGLYALIQSYITLDNFTLYKGFLQSHCLEGKKAFESAWKELKDAGYLVQYRMKDSKNQFYYEYELLDVADPPVPQNGDTALPVPQKGYTGNCRQRETGAAENGVGNNQTPYTKIYQNNIVPNHILSAYSTDDVREQIEYQVYDEKDRQQVDEIVMLMMDVLNTPDESTIRISKHDYPARLVKERFLMLNEIHIQYILEALRLNYSKIGNIKAYLLTTLYNAPSTINSYYQNRVQHDLSITISVIF